MVNIGIIDNDDIFREKFYDYITTIPNVKCVVRAKNYERFLKYFRYEFDIVIDIIFFDINSEHASGLDFIPKIQKKLPLAQIIVYTHNEGNETLIKALCMGASGYLLKDTPFSELEKSIQIIKESGSIITPRMTTKLIGYFAPPKSSPESLFNDRELQVLKLLAEGWEYKQVADKTNLSINGVRFYVKRIYKILNINSKNELMRLSANKQLLF